MRGIGVEGVASQIGALTIGADHFVVRREELIESLCRRFEASRLDAERAIQRAKDVGVVREESDRIILIMDDE